MGFSRETKHVCKQLFCDVAREVEKRNFKAAADVFFPAREAQVLLVEVTGNLPRPLLEDEVLVGGFPLNTEASLNCWFSGAVPSAALP